MKLKNLIFLKEVTGNSEALVDNHILYDENIIKAVVFEFLRYSNFKYEKGEIDNF